MSIYLIRHGQSLGNANQAIYATIPNHAIELTELGKEQAAKAAQKLLSSELKNLKVKRNIFYISPYKRTEQTAQIIIDYLKNNIKNFDYDINYDFRLVEQNAGNFTKDSEKLDIAREKYHKFYFKYPDGESGLDVWYRSKPLYDELKKDYYFQGAESFHRTPNYFIIGHSRQLRIMRLLIEKQNADWFNEQKNFPNCTIFRYTNYNSIGTIL